MTTMTTRTRASTRVLSISLMPALAARVVSAGTKIRDRGDSVVSLPRQDVPELSSAGGQVRLRMREGPWVRADPVQRSGDQRAPAGRRSLREEVARPRRTRSASGRSLLARLASVYRSSHRRYLEP